MDLNIYFKNLIDTDPSVIFICNLEHTIIYMNKAAAKAQEHRGGMALLGRNLMNCHNPHSQEMIKKVIEWFKKSQENNMLFTHYNPNEDRDVYMMALRDESGELIGYYEKHMCRTKETLPAYEGKISLA